MILLIMYLREIEVTIMYECPYCGMEYDDPFDICSNCGREIDMSSDYD